MGQRVKKTGSRGKSGIGKKILIVVGVLAALALAFFGLFYITDVEVVGNTRYTEEQISEMALQGPLSYNSILMSVFRKKLHPDAAFVESIGVTWRSRNSIRLEVQEKYPVGYLEIDGTDFFFDKNGLVLEAIAKPVPGGDDAEPDLRVYSDSGAEAQADVSSDSADASSAETTDAARNGADTTFRPALTDVPLITGLNTSNVKVGQVIATEDPSVFQVILSLTKLIDKFHIQPDQVEFTDGDNMTLYYEKVRICLGDDSYLEEKVSRVAAILPELKGMSGVLHLEEYTKETQNIIFDRDKSDADTQKD